MLLHPTCLPGPFGLGDLGPEARRFLDWAASAGFTLWQVLPLGPAGPGHSPYGCASAFAGNPLLVSPQELEREGLLPAGALGVLPDFAPDRVEFERAIPWKERLLRRSFPSAGRVRDEVQAFAAAPEQSDWLADWALFAALKQHSGGAPWWQWESDLAAREPAALVRARRELADEIGFQTWAQFLFFRQWSRLHAAARERGIAVLGDAPIYLALDSADVWAGTGALRSRRGRTAAERSPGVPPDYFSKTGQLWGNPLYRWDRMEADGFAWWIERAAREPAALRPAPDRPLSRLRRLLVRAGRRDDGLERALGARRRARRCSRPRGGPWAGCRSWPRTSA